MRTIETSATVSADHTITLQLPDDIPPGECRVVVLLARTDLEREVPLSLFRDWPSHDLGPWPEEFTASREQIYGDDGR